MTAHFHWFRIPFSLRLFCAGVGVCLLWTLCHPFTTVQAGAGCHENPGDCVSTAEIEFLDSKAVDLLIGTTASGENCGLAPDLQQVEQWMPMVGAWEPEGYDPISTWSEPPESEESFSTMLDDTDLLDLLEEESTGKASQMVSTPTSEEDPPGTTAPDTRLE